MASQLLDGKPFPATGFQPIRLPSSAIRRITRLLFKPPPQSAHFLAFGLGMHRFVEDQVTCHHGSLWDVRGPWAALLSGEHVLPEPAVSFALKSRPSRCQPLVRPTRTTCSGGSASSLAHNPERLMRSPTTRCSPVNVLRSSHSIKPSVSKPNVPGFGRAFLFKFC